MKNIWIIALISIVLGTVSCSKDDNKGIDTYSITFDTDGGTPTPSSQQIEEGKTAIAPATNPTKTGYVFMFWHLTGTSTPYNFNTPVSKDITLYAKWQAEATAEYWQVAWELNEGTWTAEDNHATQVVKGGTLAEPIAPTKVGKVFDGWYKEAGLTNKVSFPYEISAVTANITLYAKWTGNSQADGISLNKTSLELYTTDRERLAATITPAGTLKASWSTSDKQVAIVDDKGVVKATGAGVAVVTATVGNKTANCNISVNPAVFVAGDYGTSFGDKEIYLWKNGKRWILNQKVRYTISSMFIYEGDVYLSGSSHVYSLDSKDDRAVTLKLTSPILGEVPHPDDEKRNIMETTGKATRGHDIFVANGDVFVCGEERFLLENHTNKYYYRPTMWKNGKRQHLTNNTYGDRYTAQAIYVSGNDVYVTGQANSNATLWKNGILQELACDGTVQIGVFSRSEAEDIFVSGNDVYVVGMGNFPPTSTIQIPERKPILWKNGVAQILHDSGSLKTVFVSGKDVYASGFGNLWKNGVLQVIDSNASIYSVFAYGNDVYVAGYHSTNNTRLWKNGKPQELEDSRGYTYSVIVK